MNKSNERLLLQELSRWVLYSAVLSLLLLCAVYVYLSWQVAEGRVGVITENLLKDSVTHLIPLTLLFLISSLLLKHYSDLRERVESKEATQQFSRELEGILRRILQDQNPQPPVRLHEHFDDIDWARALTGASRIDVIIHYLDSWTRHIGPLLQDVFANDGKIRVILPNSDQPELIRIVSSRFPEMTEGEVTAKIQKTHERLLQLLPTEKKDRGQVQTCAVSKLVWYSAFCIDDRVLFLSPFEHERTVRIGSPVAEIDLEAYPAIRTWLRTEIDRLMACVVRKQTS